MKTLFAFALIAAILARNARAASADTYYFLFSNYNVLAGPFTTYRECAATMVAYGTTYPNLSCQMRNG